MRGSGGILLTGATGLLGRYLLRDLLLAGERVTVLARDQGPTSARERIDELVHSWSEMLQIPLATPAVLVGDVSRAHLGLTATERAWLGRRCSAVLHAAAHVGFRATPAGEPWRTNVAGTRHVLDLCTEQGIASLHHVSTAFVCGTRTDLIRESDLDVGQGFHNDYERSKYEAEVLVRQARSCRGTVYRPAVLVGDSRTGYTSSYHGIYRFLALGDRLARPALPGRRSLPLRLPFTGEEPRNLVPVDWVARAVVQILRRPVHHGRTFHLASEFPTPARWIKEVAEELLALDGVTWAGPGGLANPSALEERFLEQLADYWPYGDGDPVFDCRNTHVALPALPAPSVDRPLLRRLIRFAMADRWGRRREATSTTAIFDCALYLEEFFPAAVQRSTLAALPLDVTVGLDVRGPGGGRWTCRFTDGQPPLIVRACVQLPEVVYRLDAGTFAEIVARRVDLRDAFFDRRIEIAGDVEKGLKLAVLLHQFVQECPYDPLAPEETVDACPVAV
jgi:thioester reductase-like protein